MKYSLCLAVVLGMAACAASPLSAQSIYEGFDISGLTDGADLGSAVGASSKGFQANSSWSFLQGSGIAAFVGEGLAYMDADGNELHVSDGAVQVIPAEEGTIFGRPLATPFDLRPQSYWVSYLFRLDSPAAGDAYWTPDSTWQIAAAGLQGTQDFRFINGNFARDDLGLIQAQPGETHLVVVQIERDAGDGSSDLARLWIDPLLESPGSPNALHESTSFFDSIRNTTHFQMLFGSSNFGEYTVDELRMGSSFEDVVPLAGAVVEHCGDFDFDTDVDSSDLTTLIVGWTGAKDPGTGGKTFIDGDCDGDGDVDSSDLTSVIINWTGAKAERLADGLLANGGPGTWNAGGGVPGAEELAAVFGETAAFGPLPAGVGAGATAGHVIPVPEPAGGILWVAAAFLLAVRPPWRGRGLPRPARVACERTGPRGAAPAGRAA